MNGQALVSLHGTMANSFIASFLSVLMGSLAWAECPHAPHFTDEEKINIHSKKMVLLTHASTIYDGLKVAKPGIDVVTKWAGMKRIPIVHLQSHDQPETYYYSQCNPKYTVESPNGEFDFQVKSTHVIAMGGHWGQCLDQSLDSLMLQWRSKKKQDLKITLVTDGIYVSEVPLIKTDPYLEDFRKKLLPTLSGLGKNQDPWPYSKLSLKDLLQLIDTYEFLNGQDQDLLKTEFLMRKLPRYLRLDPHYRVELYLDGELLKVVKSGHREGLSPALKIQYLSSSALMNSEVN